MPHRVWHQSDSDRIRAWLPKLVWMPPALAVENLGAGGKAIRKGRAVLQDRASASGVTRDGFPGAITKDHHHL